jgi:hypothetical protein
VVEQLLLDLGALGDRVDAGAGEAALGELLARRLDDALLGACSRGSRPCCTALTLVVDKHSH